MGQFTLTDRLEFNLYKMVYIATLAQLWMMQPANPQPTNQLVNPPTNPTVNQPTSKVIKTIVMRQPNI